MATKRQRGDSWHYTIRRQELLAKPVYLTFPSEAEGDEYVARLESLLAQGLVPDDLLPDRKRLRLLRDHSRRYQSTQRVSADDSKVLRIVLMRLPITFELPAMTFTWASEWVTSLKREQNLSPSTIRHHVGALARCLDWIAAHGDMPLNPLRLLPRGYSTYTDGDTAAVAKIEGAKKISEERERRLEPGEEPAIRSVLAGTIAPIKQRPLVLTEATALTALFDLALESGMRMAEMYTIDVSQVNLAERTVFLDKTKNGSKRQVPLSTVAVRVLRDFMPAQGRVFPWWDGVATHRAKTTALVSRQFSRIFEAAGCGDLHFHDLRHEATCRLYERTNLSDVEIAKILGWRSLRQAIRYANLRSSVLAQRMW